MKRIIVSCFLAAAVAASGQTAAKTTAASPAAAKTAAPASTTAKPAATATATASQPWFKLPPNVPKELHGPIKTMPFVIHYEDIKVGTGAVGESGKMWHIKYTGWRAADGVKFDTTDDHKRPVIGKDGKPELDADGKPKMGEAEPLAFPQGMGRLIPGFDYGVEGMKIGGKRRIFIPWQLAYGTHAMPDRPDHPGIPAKSDLIFDVELVDVTEPTAPHPAPPINRPVMPGNGTGSTSKTGETGIGKPAAPGAVPAATPAAPAAAKPAAPATTAPATPAANPATPAAAPTAPSATAASPAAPAQPATTTQPAAPATPGTTATQPK
jgi:peptidylprolyl isomerase